MIFDAEGNLGAKHRVEVEPYYSDRPGWAEQDPDRMWGWLCEACRGLWARSPVSAEGVAAVALTTQRATMVNVDVGGVPLRPAIVWLDQRRCESLAPLGGLWGAAFRAVRMRQTVDHFRKEAEANWLRLNQPEIWHRTHKYLFLSGFLNFKLVGEFVDSIASQVGYVPFDYRRLRWAGPRDWKWRALGIEPRMLPRLLPPGEVLGQVTRSAAEATGIPAGTPVVAAAADKACEVLGAGCLEPERACLSYGTSATLNTTHTRYVGPVPMLPPYPSAVPGAFNLEIQIYRGYWLVSWFKKEFGLRERRIAETRGIEPEALFDELVKSVPPGAMGLVLQPYWSPGVKVPGPEAKGAMIGFGDVHTRAHVYRAILEGLAYALREGGERSQRRSGVQLAEVRVAGGGSQSDQAMQITADVFGLPASRPHVFEASGLGAAIDAATGIGLHPDFRSAVASMTRVRDTFEPDPKTREIYDGLYREVYLKLYRRLQPLYRTIRSVTGYPP
jgi:sugar (pentulose or hexulose) kinase